MANLIGSLGSTVLNRIFPGRKVWYRDDDVIKFKVGGFAGSHADRPAFASKLYYEVTKFSEIIGDLDRNIQRSLEIGCGYGRLSPWFDELSDDHHALDPNSEAIRLANKEYPQVRFHKGRGDNLSFDSTSFDLIITVAVLHHIPPDVIPDVVDEISRVCQKGGYVITCEKIRGESSDHVWRRNLEEYQGLFSQFELVHSEPRPVEHSYYDKKNDTPLSETMVFKKTGRD